MKRAKKHPPPQPQAAQSGRALAAARQGRTARQDRRPRSASAPSVELRASCATRPAMDEKRSAARLPQSPPRSAVCRATTSKSGRMRELYLKSVGGVARAERRAALRVAERHARGEAEGRGLVGVRLRIAAVESALPDRRSAAGAACAGCTALLPVVDGVARHAPRCPGSCSRSIRGGACRGVAYRLPSPARDRRAASPVAARDGRRRRTARSG